LESSTHAWHASVHESVIEVLSRSGTRFPVHVDVDTLVPVGLEPADLTDLTIGVVLDLVVLIDLLAFFAQGTAFHVGWAVNWPSLVRSVLSDEAGLGFPVHLVAFIVVTL
jgi:hypothetical protein